MAYLPGCNLASLTEGQIDFIGTRQRRQPFHKYERMEEPSVPFSVQTHIALAIPPSRPHSDARMTSAEVQNRAGIVAFSPNRELASLFDALAKLMAMRNKIFHNAIKFRRP